jgi:hypothetical protein
MEPDETKHDTKRIVWGVFLVALGALLLFERFGAFGWGGMVHWWPLILVALGVTRLIERRPGSALTLFLMGGWFMLCEYGWQGFTYGNSWGLVLVAVGAGIVVRALSGEQRSHRGLTGGPF